MSKRLGFSIVAAAVWCVGCTAKSEPEPFEIMGQVDLAPAPFQAGVARSWDLAVIIPGEAVIETDYPAGGPWLDFSSDTEGNVTIDLTDVDVPDHSSSDEQEMGPQIGSSIVYGPEMSSCTPGQECLRSFVLTMQTDVDATFTELVFGLSVIDGERTPKDEGELSIEVEATEKTD
jgi:hypothetical protein